MSLRRRARRTVWFARPLVVLALLVGMAGLAADVSGQARSRQDPAQRGGVWLGVGLGGGASEGLDADGAVSVQFGVQWREHRISLRNIVIADIGGFPDGSDDSVAELGLLYGRRVSAGPGFAALSAGPAAVSAKGFDGKSSEIRRTVGLSVVAEAGLRGRIVGLALQAFGNLNSVTRYGGVSVSLLLGWLP